MWKRTEPRDSGFYYPVTFAIMIAALVALLSGGCQDEAYGGWGPRGCAPVGAPVFVPQQRQYVATAQWHYPADWRESGQISLYRGNVLEGSYDYYSGLYTPANGSEPYHPQGYPVWPAKDVTKKGCPCKKCDGNCKCGKGRCCGDRGCKCCCPQEETVFQADQNFGINLDQMNSSGQPRYTLHDNFGARELTEEEARNAVEKGLPDDSSKPYLVAVCTNAELRGKVFGDLYSSPALAWLRDHVRLQAYADAKHFHLDGYKLDQDQRFQNSGLMMAVVQTPNKEGLGKRLYVQYDYDGGPERLAAEAKRRIDPNFDPNKDGQPKPPTPTPRPDGTPDLDLIALIGQLFATLPGWSYVVAALGAALLILKGGK